MTGTDAYIARAEIGSRLRKIRTQAGLTQIQLSQALGHNSSHRINQVELGRSRLYVDELYAICRALGCTATDILGACEPPKEADFAELLDHLDSCTRKVLMSALQAAINEMNTPCGSLARKLTRLPQDQLFQIDAIVTAMMKES